MVLSSLVGAVSQLVNLKQELADLQPPVQDVVRLRTMPLKVVAAHARVAGCDQILRPILVVAEFHIVLELAQQLVVLIT